MQSPATSTQVFIQLHLLNLLCKNLIKQLP